MTARAIAPCSPRDSLSRLTADRCTRRKRRPSMGNRIMQLAFASLTALAFIGAGLSAFAQDDHGLIADRIGSAAETKATTTKDGVVRLAWPRDDVKVTVDGMELKPFAGLGSWAAFAPTKGG